MLLHPLLDYCAIFTASLISKEAISFADSMATFEEHVSPLYYPSVLTDEIWVLWICILHL